MADRYDDSVRKRAASRSRGQSRSRSGQRAASSNTRYSASTGKTSSYSYGNKKSSGYDNGRKDDGGLNLGIVIGLSIAAVIIAAGLFAISKNGLGVGPSVEKIEDTTFAATEAFDPDTIHDDVYVDVSSFAPETGLIDINGMNREQVKAAILATYSWNLTVNNTNPSIDHFSMPDLSTGKGAAETEKAESTSGDTDNDGSEQMVQVDDPYAGVTIRPEATKFVVPDLIALNLDEMIEQIFADYEQKAAQETAETSGSESESETGDTSAVQEATADYALALPDFTSQITDYMNQLALVWKMNPKNGDITSYDSSSGEFVFGGSVDGYEVNASATASRVMEAINSHKYDSAVDADGSKISASVSSIKDKYQTIGSFTTKTTANSVRNGNIKRAAAAINGTVLQPGEEFSFNETVGQRTEEKGYGGAPAYNEGEVVTEVGGGVCQVSSTLYNAVFRAGLTTTYRRSHTFAPTYVTPGTDATVSWPGPDYKFVNNSDHAIGIRAWYSDQTMNVQIYGIRILPEGVSWELVSEKATDLPVPAAQIITEGEESEGTAGSEWQAYKIIHNADGTTEKVKDHYTHYSGHTPKKYAEGTVASVAETESAVSTDESVESSADPTESSAAENSSSEETQTTSEEYSSAETPQGDTAGDIIEQGPSLPQSSGQPDAPEGPVAQFEGSGVDDGLIVDGPVVNG